MLKYIVGAVGGMVPLVIGYFSFCGVAGLIDTHDRVSRIEAALASLSTKTDVAANQNATMNAINTVGVSVGNLAEIATTGATHAMQANAKLDEMRKTQLADSAALAGVAKETAGLADRIGKVEAEIKKNGGVIWGLRTSVKDTQMTLANLNFIKVEIEESR
jgi:hypothetical protein